MNKKQDSDLLADVIWWIKGYIAGNISDGEQCCFDNDHLRALVQAKIFAENQEEFKDREAKDAKP